MTLYCRKMQLVLWWCCGFRRRMLDVIVPSLFAHKLIENRGSLENGGVENGSISPTVNPRRLSCGLTPECVQVPQVAVSKESGGRKEAAQHIGSQAGSTGRRCTRTHSMQRRRQNVKAASGRQLLVPPLLSAWRLRWSWVASRRPMRLNSLKMSKHLRGVRAVPGPDNHQPPCAAHTLTNLGGNLSHSCVTFSVKCFDL